MSKGVPGADDVGEGSEEPEVETGDVAVTLSATACLMCVCPWLLLAKRSRALDEAAVLVESALRADFAPR